MSLQAKPGLDESEMLMDLFFHAYRCLGHTDTHTLPYIPMGLCALQNINTQLSYKGAHISSVHIHTYLPLYLEVILLPPPALYPSAVKFPAGL